METAEQAIVTRRSTWLAVNIADGPQSIDLLRDRLHESLYLPDIMGGRTAAYRLALPPGSPSLGAKNVRIAH